jgi:hypothetical protein
MPGRTQDDLQADLVAAVILTRTGPAQGPGQGQRAPNCCGSGRW